MKPSGSLLAKRRNCPSSKVTKCRFKSAATLRASVVLPDCRGPSRATIRVSVMAARRRVSAWRGMDAGGMGIADTELREICNYRSTDSEYSIGRFGMETRQIRNQSSADWESKPGRLGIAHWVGNHRQPGIAFSTTEQLIYKLLFHIYSPCSAGADLSASIRQRQMPDVGLTDAGRVGLTMAAGRISASVVENQTIPEADDMPFCFFTADQRGLIP